MSLVEKKQPKKHQDKPVPKAHKKVEVKHKEVIGPAKSMKVSGKGDKK